MRTKLIQYIDLLFAGTALTQEVADFKEKLTRNTLDRFDDLMQQGKSEEAAYNLAVSGIGNINELLRQVNQTPAAQPVSHPYTPPVAPPKKKGLPAIGRWLIAILWVLAVLLYLVVSFSTRAWLITWLIFPITGAASQVVRACFDLSRRVARFVIFLIILVFLSLAFARLLPQRNTMHFGFTGDYFFKDRSYNVGAAAVSQPVNEIDITWINGSVTVKTYSGSEILMQENSGLKSAEQLRWRIENGRLTIYPRRAFWILGAYNIGSLPEKDLTLLLPADTALRELEIDSVSAPIQLMNLQIDQLQLKQVSGSTVMQNMTGNDLELNTANGKLLCIDCQWSSLDLDTVSGDVDYTGILAEAEINTVSADTNIESSRPLKELDCNSVSGDFCITLPEGSGFRVELDSAGGDLKSDFPLTDRGDSKISGSGSGDYSFNTVSGDVSLLMK